MMNKCVNYSSFLDLYLSDELEEMLNNQNMRELNRDNYHGGNHRKNHIKEKNNVDNITGKK